MNVIVCGTRRHLSDKDLDAIRDTLNLTLDPDVDTVVHGGASGVDWYADMYAVEMGMPIHVHHADWGRYGKSAGPRRNQEMLDHEDVELVIAFPSDHSVGTWDMVERAVKAHVPVRVYPL